MAIKFVHHPFPASHLLPSIPTPKPLSLIRRITHKSCRDFIIPTNPSRSNPNSTIKVAEQQSYELVGEDTAVAQIKSDINRAVRGINRGIFGIPSVKKSEIEGLVELLESQNPNPDINQNLEKVDGCWKLIYSTITILGSKRTKLGLRDFISLGDVLQIIDVAKGKAVNMIKFNVRGLNLLNGKLTIEASFKMTSKSRVEITYVDSTITPDQLMSMFQKNYDLLLGIFNPEGWLEITYVDDTMRIGRDDKGNIFILERANENNV